MPFLSEEDEVSSRGFALPDGFDLNPDRETPQGSVLGAAFRRENVFGSALSSFELDPEAPYDPSYRPFEDIQGTHYEQHSERFVEVRNIEQSEQLKAQIDREIEDSRVIQSAGTLGFLAELGAGLLSPTSLLPGGAIVKGVKGGVSIGKTSLSVAASTGAAVAIDEIALQSTQETRTGAESAAAIAGGVILGGLLGSAAGSISRAQFNRTAKLAEELPEAIDSFNQALLTEFKSTDRSLSAADPNVDLTVRNEARLQIFKNIPILRNVVRTDPLIRTQMSPNNETRRAVAQLSETVLQYEANADGIAPNAGNVETAVKVRRNTELARTVSDLERSYGEYVKDGPAGLVGRATAPVVGRFGHLVGLDKKLSRADFYQEVGRALRRGDKHPFPQVQKAADEIRKNVFDRAKNEAIEVGLFDEGLQLKNADSYFTRVYNVEKIVAHRNDKSGNDFADFLVKNLQTKRQEAQRRLEQDDTLERIEDDLRETRRSGREAARLLNKALNKARGKRDRAEGAITRERSIARATDALSKRFEKRKADLRNRVGKTYARETDKEWRETLLDSADGSGQTKAGDALDSLVARETAARKLLDCLSTASMKSCLKAFPLAKSEKDRLQVFREQFGDDELAVQAYLNSLTPERESLQSALADQGVLVDLADGAPEPSLYQNIQATIRSTRGALNNRPMDILQAIRAAGGFKPGLDHGEIASALDTKALSVTRKSGLQPDYMREALVESGYLPENADLNDMWDFMRQAADGEDVFSRQEFGPEIEAYEAAQAFAAELEANGLNISEVSADDIIGLETKLAHDQGKASIKAGEAGRSADKTSKVTQGADNRLISALKKLDEADARLHELNEIAAPKVREEIKVKRAEALDLQGKLRTAKDARAWDKQLADADDLELDAIAQDTVNAIVGMKPGEHSYQASMSKPTRARTLDIDDIDLEPWLESDAGVVMSQYFNNIVPDIELSRAFPGGFTEVERKITEEGQRRTAAATSEKERIAIDAEVRQDITDLRGMRDRIRGRYGVPDDPKHIVTQAARTMRTATYMGYLGGMTLSAMPDVAGVIGRNGIEAAFGSVQALTDPKRMKLAVQDATELGAAAEWFLNSRAVSIAELTDEYGSTSRFDRALGQGARVFSQATGMLAWNAGWKSVGGAMIASKMSKLASKVADGTAGTGDLIKLGENGIDKTMALRIAKQLDQHGDKDGHIWLPKAGEWDDQIAFDAMRAAFNRELDLMIITPGQDKPLMFSNEVGKFFSQFKSFTASAHHRILLSGIQRADSDVLAQITTAIALGMLVSKVKAYAGGYEQKEGAAAWEDAIDRSGVGGWFFEAHGIANGMTGGALSLSGEQVSRFGSRSAFQGLLGPSVDMGSNFYEGMAAGARGELSKRDARNLLRPVPGNNLPYFTGLTNKIAEAMADRL